MDVLEQDDILEFDFQCEPGEWFYSLQSSWLLPDWLFDDPKHKYGFRLPLVGDEGKPDVVFHEALRASLLSFRIKSSASAVKRLVTHVAKRVAKVDGLAVRGNGLSKAVSLLLLNLYRLRLSDHRRLLVVSLNASDYGTNNVPVSHHSTKRAFEGLIALGLLTNEARGFRDRSKSKGFRTRCTGTQEMYDLFDTYGIRPSMIQYKTRKRLLELRAPRPLENEVGYYAAPKIVRWPKSHKKERLLMERNLKRINRSLKDAFVGLHIPDSGFRAINAVQGKKRMESQLLDLTQKELYRAFNDSDPEKGGRFYGGFWMHIPKGYRKYIYLASDGDAISSTVELDYSGLHPRMLYAIEGIQGKEDLYEIYPDAPMLKGRIREYVKLLLLQMLNVSTNDGDEDGGKIGDRTSAIRAANSALWDRYETNAKRFDSERKCTVQETLPLGCPSVAQMIDDIHAAHGPIQHHFYTGVGKSLMYRDSRLAENIMVRAFEESETVVLPVHDSFIVPAAKEADLRRYMAEEFERAFGTQIRIDKKPTEQDAADWETDTGLMVDPELTNDFGDTGYTVWDTLAQDWANR